MENQNVETVKVNGSKKDWSDFKVGVAHAILTCLFFGLYMWHFLSTHPSSNPFYFTRLSVAQIFLGPFFAGVVSIFLLNKIFVIKDKKRTIFTAAGFFLFAVIGVAVFHIVQTLPYVESFRPTGVAILLVLFPFLETFLFFVASETPSILIWINNKISSLSEVFLKRAQIVLPIFTLFLSFVILAKGMHYGWIDNTLDRIIRYFLESLFSVSVGVALVSFFMALVRVEIFRTWFIFSFWYCLIWFLFSFYSSHGSPFIGPAGYIFTDLLFGFFFILISLFLVFYKLYQLRENIPPKA